jgi:hypothetical protein
MRAPAGMLPSGLKHDSLTTKSDGFQVLFDAPSSGTFEATIQMTRVPVLVHRIPLFVVICSHAEVFARA